MSIGLEGVIADHDLSLVRDMSGEAGNELQVDFDFVRPVEDHRAGFRLRGVSDRDGDPITRMLGTSGEVAEVNIVMGATTLPRKHAPVLSFAAVTGIGVCNCANRTRHRRRDSRMQICKSDSGGRNIRETPFLGRDDCGKMGSGTGRGEQYECQGSVDCSYIYIMYH